MSKMLMGGFVLGTLTGWAVFCCFEGRNHDSAGAVSKFTIHSPADTSETLQRNLATITPSAVRRNDIERQACCSRHMEGENTVGKECFSKVNMDNWRKPGHMSNAERIRRIGDRLAISVQGADSKEIENIMKDEYWNPKHVELNDSQKQELKQLLQARRKEYDSKSTQFRESKTVYMDQAIASGAIQPIDLSEKMETLPVEMQIEGASYFFGAGKNGKNYRLPITQTGTPQLADQFRELRLYPLSSHDELVGFFEKL